MKFAIVVLSLVQFLFVDIHGDYAFRGETYTMNSLEGWEPATSERIAGRPSSRKLYGFEATISSRISNDRDGSSLQIIELIGCKDYKQIQHTDSVNHSKSDLVESVVWNYSDNEPWQSVVEIVHKPIKHPETGQESVLMRKEWYIAGVNNVYVVSYANDNKITWYKWLPKIEKLLYTLNEANR